MTIHNRNFELTIADIDLIETALRSSKRELTVGRAADAAPSSDDGETVSQIHDLLGRLHNQKVFYRPQKGAYIGG